MTPATNQTNPFFRKSWIPKGAIGALGMSAATLIVLGVLAYFKDLSFLPPSSGLPLIVGGNGIALLTLIGGVLVAQEKPEKRPKPPSQTVTACLPLPKDMMGEIGKYLTLQDHWNCMHVNRAFRHFATPYLTNWLTQTLRLPEATTTDFMTLAKGIKALLAREIILPEQAVYRANKSPNSIATLEKIPSLQQSFYYFQHRCQATLTQENLPASMQEVLAVWNRSVPLTPAQMGRIQEDLSAPLSKEARNWSDWSPSKLKRRRQTWAVALTIYVLVLGGLITGAVLFSRGNLTPRSGDIVGLIVFTELAAIFGLGGVIGFGLVGALSQEDDTVRGNRDQLYRRLRDNVGNIQSAFNEYNRYGEVVLLSMVRTGALRVEEAKELQSILWAYAPLQEQHSNWNRMSSVTRQRIQNSQEHERSPDDLSYLSMLETINGLDKRFQALKTLKFV